MIEKHQKGKKYSATDITDQSYSTFRRYRIAVTSHSDEHTKNMKAYAKNWGGT